MDNVKRFVEDAVLGGYALSHYDATYSLLDPKAWQAVGKTRGWGKTDYCGHCGAYYEDSPVWREQLHEFLDLLCDGKTIDEALGIIGDKE